jgi:hypothetical protein
MSRMRISPDKVRYRRCIDYRLSLYAVAAKEALSVVSNGVAQFGEIADNIAILTGWGQSHSERIGRP